MIELYIYIFFYSIPLPPWVLEEMSKNPDIVYTDRSGRRNPEYISLGCDSLPVLRGRTPIQVYSDYMASFRDTFKEYLGDVIVVRYDDKTLVVRFKPFKKEHNFKLKNLSIFINY